MNQEEERKNVADMKRCPTCKSKNFIHGWGADRWSEVRDGKVVYRGYAKVGLYHSFKCSDCEWERTDTE